MPRISLAALLLASASPLLAAPQPRSHDAQPVAHSRLVRQMVGGVNVTGLDPSARGRRLRRQLRRKLRTHVLLKGGARQAWQSRSSVGIELDLGWMLGRAARGDAYVPLKLRVNLQRSIAAMKRLSPRFEVRGAEASILNQRRGMKIVPETIGQQLNPAGSAVRLLLAVQRSSDLTEFPLMVHKQRPRRVRADFKGINGRLATFSTEYNPGKKGRTFNMVLASRAINGTLVKPGGTFSLNDAVGERTRARGYQAAIIFENQKEKQGLGGGVSQITGTLFNAALLAGLPIQTYQTHSRPVVYLPIGRDATVSWGNFDMKFKNPTSAPLYITYVVKNGTATASIFGRRTQGQKVRLKVVSKTLGPRHIVAQLYRTILRKGKVALKQKVGDSSYNWKADNAD